MKLTGIAATLIAIAAPVQAGMVDGNWLKAHLASQDVFDKTVGLGYVMGVFDSGSSLVFCADDGVTAGQAMAVIAKYLDDNPQKLHLPAADLGTLALVAAFPCKIKRLKRP